MPVLALFLLALGVPVLDGCAVIDKPILALRGVAGGIHNRRKVSGIEPFFVPDGRMGVAANGALLLEDFPGGELVLLAKQTSEIDDPCPSPDGSRVVFVAGRDQVTAGGGHNDHVYQVYSMALPGDLPVGFGGAPVNATWTRVTRSRRAEVLPHFTSDGERIVFVRRVEYEPYSLYASPWGHGALLVAAADGSWETQLTEPLFYPFRGLTLTADDATVLFAASVEEGRFDVYAVELRAGAEPSLVVADASFPAVLPGGERFAFVRGGDIWTAPLDGSGAEPLGLERGEIVGLAVAPDGERFLFTELEPDLGWHGEYRLYEVRADGVGVRELHRLEGRSTKRTKPLDVVKPFGWWFRSGEMSPGSR